jgi:hypothetical protein
LSLDKAKKQSFIPQDEPKLFVICRVAFILGVLSFLLMAAYNFLFGVSWVVLPLAVIVAVCIPVGGLASVAYYARRAFGCYREVKSKPWREQVW